MVGFPLLLIPLAIYNIVVFLMPGVSLVDPLFKLPLMSGADWSVTLSDVLLALGILLLLFEVIKGARPGAKYLTDHLLSLIIFGAAAAEFLLWPHFGTSTYFLLAILALAEFLSGISLRVRRGVQTAPAAARARREVSRNEAPQFEPHFVPPEPARPAASVAETAPPDRSDPKLVPPGAGADHRSAEDPMQPTPHPESSPETTAPPRS